MTNNNYYDDATAADWSMPGSKWNNMATAILAGYSVSTNYTGSGAYVRSTAASLTSASLVSPTLVTPTLGTPASVTLTNGTGLPISSGVSGLGSNVATFLATPSSANLATAVTDETGSGSLVFGTSPTMSNVTVSTLVMNTTDITKIRQACFNGIIDDGNSSTADTIDWSAGSIHKSTLTGNCTYTFTAPSGVARLSLQIVQGAGPYTVTWPASVKWAGAAAPTLGTTSGRSDWITFIWDGTNYWGTASTNFN